MFEMLLNLCQKMCFYKLKFSLTCQGHLQKLEKKRFAMTHFLKQSPRLPKIEKEFLGGGG